MLGVALKERVFVRLGLAGCRIVDDLDLLPGREIAESAGNGAVAVAVETVGAFEAMAVRDFHVAIHIGERLVVRQRVFFCGRMTVLSAKASR